MRFRIVKPLGNNNAAFVQMYAFLRTRERLLDASDELKVLIRNIVKMYVYPVVT